MAKLFYNLYIIIHSKTFTYAKKHFFITALLLIHQSFAYGQSYSELSVTSSVCPGAIALDGSCNLYYGAVDKANQLLSESGDGSRKSNPNGGAPPVTNVNNGSAPSFAVFPNPTYGMLTATAAGGGTFYVYTIEGQQVGEYAISSGNTDIMLPVALAPGIYMGVFKPAIGGKQSTVRLVYQP